MPEGAAQRIGGYLRAVPGMPALLDARVRRMLRRRHRKAAAARSAEATLARARDPVRLQELGARGGVRLNIGCGPGTLPEWVNVDIASEPEDVLYMDATRPWPLPDGSVDAINSEHFIEHITGHEACFYLEEAARVLRSGGVIRTSTPSLEGVIDAYLKADPEVLAAYRSHPHRNARNHADMLNNYFFMWAHRHVYDVGTLTTMLEEAGFESIETASFGDSRHSVLRGIDIHDEGLLLRDHVFVIDAVRP